MVPQRAQPEHQPLITSVEELVFTCLSICWFVCNQDDTKKDFSKEVCGQGRSPDAENNSPKVSIIFSGIMHGSGSGIFRGRCP